MDSTGNLRAAAISGADSMDFETAPVTSPSGCTIISSPDKQLQSAHERPAADSCNAGESLASRAISGTIGSVTNTLNMTSRVLGLVFSGTTSVLKAVSSRSPEPLAQFFHDNGGMCGKIGQYLALFHPPLESLETKYSSDYYNYVAGMVKTASEYSAGEVDPEEIKKIIERNVATARMRAMLDRSGTADIDSGSEFIANNAVSAVTVRHIETLGRGTICQIDRFTIDERDYAVKSFSGKSLKSINRDVSIMTSLLSAIHNIGIISQLEFNTLFRAAKSFSLECDLSKELEYTKKASEALNNLTEVKQFHVNTGSGHHVPVQFRVPEVAEALSSPDALVMEYIDGCSIDRQKALKDRLTAWRPEWKNGERLSEAELNNIIIGIYKLVLSVYLESARKSRFLNTDFQVGNFMMKLESNYISIYSIDHANSIANVDFLSLITEHIHCKLVDGMFLFFHNRATGNGQVEEQNIPCSTDTANDIDVHDLVYTPLSVKQQEQLAELITSYRRDFGQEIIPPIEDLQPSQGQATIGEICRQLYHWLKDKGQRSDPGAPVPPESVFVNILPRFFIQLAEEYKEQDMTTNTEFKLLKVVAAFDNFFQGMGFPVSQFDPLLVRVKAQLAAYRHYLAHQERQLKNSLSQSQSF
ncbi:AarF/UbiB family protein [Endozoicomonas acroporae]|uniref:AarF/UbiB family protein n=1 Tax=Endozoicomonas acroporae TaxID=1701104 RepID=UPI0013D5531F|nr:AarF/UbiB family protein [Endozoicomonas acroporae]